jgi:hypothetical protein
MWCLGRPSAPSRSLGTLPVMQSYSPLIGAHLNSLQTNSVSRPAFMPPDDRTPGEPPNIYEVRTSAGTRPSRHISYIHSHLPSYPQVRHNVVLAASLEFDNKGALVVYVFRPLSFAIKETLQMEAQWPPGYTPAPQGPSRPQTSSQQAAS